MSTSAPIFFGVNCFRYEIFDFIWESCLKNSGKYLFFLKCQFSQWKAAAIKFSFSRFFFQKHLISLFGKFQHYQTSPSSFLAKITKINHIFHLIKYLLQNIGIFPSLQKKSPAFVEKWAKNKCLLVYIFLLLNFHCLTYSAML